jgi:hypothetical protein
VDKTRVNEYGYEYSGEDEPVTSGGEHLELEGSAHGEATDGAAGAGDEDKKNV